MFKLYTPHLRLLFIYRYIIQIDTFETICSFLNLNFKYFNILKISSAHQFKVKNQYFHLIKYICIAIEHFSNNIKHVSILKYGFKVYLNLLKKSKHGNLNKCII